MHPFQVVMEPSVQIVRHPVSFVPASQIALPVRPDFSIITVHAHSPNVLWVHLSEIIDSVKHVLRGVLHVPQVRIVPRAMLDGHWMMESVSAIVQQFNHNFTSLFLDRLIDKQVAQLLLQ